MASQTINAKVLTIGDVSVGKTSLMLRYVKNQFSDNYNVTVGVEFLVQKVDVNGKTIALQLWDTAGHERFRSVVKSFFKEAACVVLCYSLNNRKSFENIEGWIKTIKESTDTDPFLVLVGTQKDLERVVSETEAEELRRLLGINMYKECSAKENAGVQEIFLDIAKHISEKGVPKPRHTLPGNKGEGIPSIATELKKAQAINPSNKKEKNCNC